MLILMSWSVPHFAFFCNKHTDLSHGDHLRNSPVWNIPCKSINPHTRSLSNSNAIGLSDRFCNPIKLHLHWGVDWNSPYIDEALISFERGWSFYKSHCEALIPMQLIKSEVFGTVSVCQCDSGSNNKTTAPLATAHSDTQPHRNLKGENLKIYLQKHS